MVSFLKKLESTDQYSYYQKTEMVSIMRKSEPAIQSSMIATALANIPKSRQTGESPMSLRESKNIRKAEESFDETGSVSRVAAESGHQPMNAPSPIQLVAYRYEDQEAGDGKPASSENSLQQPDIVTQTDQIQEPKTVQRLMPAENRIAFQSNSPVDRPVDSENAGSTGTLTTVAQPRLVAALPSAALPQVIPPVSGRTENLQKSSESGQSSPVKKQTKPLVKETSPQPLQSPYNFLKTLPTATHHENDPVNTNAYANQGVPEEYQQASDDSERIAGTRVSFADMNERNNEKMPGETPDENGMPIPSSVGRNAAPKSEKGAIVNERPLAGENRKIIPTDTSRQKNQDDEESGMNESNPNIASNATTSNIAMVMSKRPENWEQATSRAINALNAQLISSGQAGQIEQTQNEIQQRLLNLVLGNQRDAIRPINHLSPDLQEFWRNEMLGLATMLDDISIPDASQRYAVAQHHLQTAGIHLQNECPIRIKNLQFVNQCDGFGAYDIAKNEFQPGEPVFIYSEIDNLVCKEENSNFVTKVSSSYEIIDLAGKRVANGDYDECGKNTRSRIRDVFLVTRVDLPVNIAPGRYFLKLTVTDMNHPNHLLDQQRLEFQVTQTQPAK